MCHVKYLIKVRNIFTSCIKSNWFRGGNVNRFMEVINYKPRLCAAWFAYMPLLHIVHWDLARLPALTVIGRQVCRFKDSTIGWDFSICFDYYMGASYIFGVQPNIFGFSEPDS